MSDHGVGFDLTDHPTDGFAQRKVGLEMAVRLTEEPHVGHTNSRGRLALFALSHGL